MILKAQPKRRDKGKKERKKKQIRKYSRPTVTTFVSFLNARVWGNKQTNNQRKNSSRPKATHTQSVLFSKMLETETLCAVRVLFLQCASAAVRARNRKCAWQFFFVERKCPSCVLHQAVQPPPPHFFQFIKADMERKTVTMATCDGIVPS